MRRLVLLLLPIPILAQQPSPSDSAKARGIIQAAAPISATELAMGKRMFDASCARCHGIGGVGDLGPPLNHAELRSAPTDSALRSIIKDGIPGTSMPGFFYIWDDDARKVVAYVRSLGRVAPEPLTGNAGNGRVVYDRLGCASCHTLSGVGGVVGPELTDIGVKRSVAHLRRSITDPGASLADEGGVFQYLVTRVETRDGRSVMGTRVNEDGFSIQLRDLNGRMHSFRKSELRTLDKDFKSSLMPSYRETITTRELDDIIAYLARRGRGSQP